MNEDNISLSSWMSQARGFYKTNIKKLITYSVIVSSVIVLIGYFLPSESLSTSIWSSFDLFMIMIMYQIYNRSRQTPITEVEVTNRIKNNLPITIWSMWRLFPLFLLLIIPGLIFSIFWSLVFFVILDKTIRGKTALDYSKKLVQGNWWKIFWILLLENLSILFLAFILYWFLGNNLLSDLIIGNLAGLIRLYFVVVLMFAYFGLDNFKNPPAAPISSEPLTPQI